MIPKQLIATAAAVAAAGALAIPALASTSTVTVKDNAFSPRTLTVHRGATVKWVWRGHAPHNVTVTRGPVRFHSTTQVKGSFSRRLTRSGSYTIVCTIHSGMKMTLRVR